MPRFLLIVKASDKGEDYHPPNKGEMYAAMNKFNNDMVAAGVMLSGNGLAPSAKDGHRVRFSSDPSSPQIEKGPFDTHNLVSGYWVIKTKDVDEALGWAKKIPFQEGEVEVRRVVELEDFKDHMSEEQMDKERKLHADLVKQSPGDGN